LPSSKIEQFLARATNWCLIPRSVGAAGTLVLTLFLNRINSRSYEIFEV